MGMPAFAEGRCIDRRGAGERMTEDDLARALVRPDQMITLGRSEVTELIVTAACRFHHGGVPGAFQGRHEEKHPGLRR